MSTILIQKIKDIDYNTTYIQYSHSRFQFVYCIPTCHFKYNVPTEFCKMQLFMIVVIIMDENYHDFAS